MVIRDGKPIFKKTYGCADTDAKTPIDTKTNFRLASVTKQFTAMCIMMLVEQGGLLYNSSLKEIFPDFPEYGRNITIHHLLHHTSGLIAYETLIPDTATVQVLDRDVLALLMKQDSTYFAPGSSYRYSNSGYAVLAMVVEKISGKAFALFLKDNIFDPLGMRNTVAYEKGISTVSRRAFGHTLADSVFTPTDQSMTSAVLGDGGIYSSVEDMFRWDQALYTDRLVSDQTLRKAFTSGTLHDGRQTGYGFGWNIDEYRGLRRIWHAGSTTGFRSVIQRYPNEKLTVIILANSNVPNLPQLAEKLTDIFLP